MTLIHTCTYRHTQIHTQGIHPKATEYMFFSNALETFSRVDHMWPNGHKTSQ